VDQAQLDGYLRTHKNAVMATIARDGHPQLSNVLVAYRDGKLLISITETRVKYRNLRRDPRVSLTILGDNFFQYVVVYGRAELIHMPEAAAALREYYELAAGKPHPNWDEYDRSMREDRRVLAVITIDRTYSLPQ
jgi:PPOX class probable F420-dependent enzyme